MKETIIFAPGANGTELTRSLASFEKNTLGFRIFSSVELARFALTRSGYILRENFLQRKQEAAVIDSFIRKIPYFASAAFSDSEKIAAALSSLRELIPENEAQTLENNLKKGEFLEKNQSLMLVYENYLNTLKKENALDSIGLIRTAIENTCPIDCVFLTIREFPLSPLEMALADAIAPQRKEISLIELFGQQPENTLIVDYNESYGSVNEVETVFEYIASHNLPLDQCTVAIAGGDNYCRLLYDFAATHNILTTFGCGLPILSATPAMLLKLLNEWNTSGYNGIDALRALIFSNAFDKKKLRTALGIETGTLLNHVIEAAGSLRLSCDKNENNARLSAYQEVQRENLDTELFSALRCLAAELSLGESKLIQKYAVIRDGFAGRIDRSALSVVCDALTAYQRFSESASLEQIIPEILKKNVCSENSREGALYITSITGALSAVRKNLFIVGLSASNFPGMPRENYLILDSDYLLFADKKNAPISSNRILQNKKVLKDVLSLSAALKVKTHLSYSSYALADLKEENPSSVLFEIFKNQSKTEVTMQDFYDVLGHIGYFGQKISDSRQIGKAYNDGYEITFTDSRNTIAPSPALTSQPFSPTAIDDFFSCPRHFFLTRLLGIREPEEDNPFQIISPADTGTLVHALMEELSKNYCSREEFLRKADLSFDAFLKTRPPIHADAAKTEKADFMRLIKNAYDLDPKNEVIASEEKNTVLHPSGIHLQGIPDRVEKSKDGSFIIADYKTGRKINHKADDIDSCLQVVIYAYLSEQSGIPVTRCEYRYLRDGKTIPCRYDDAMKEKLSQKLQTFKTALDSGIFEPTDSATTCQYCKLKHLCDGMIEEKEEEK